MPTIDSIKRQITEKTPADSLHTLFLKSRDIRQLINKYDDLIYPFIIPNKISALKLDDDMMAFEQDFRSYFSE